MAAGFKWQLLKEAKTDTVISIAAVEALDLKNIDGAYGMARKDILENIAAGDDMPAKILIDETFAEGFGEGTEDAKNIAQFINRVRIGMNPLYEFFDKIVQYRAWNEDFYGVIQGNFPEMYRVGRMLFLFRRIPSLACSYEKLSFAVARSLMARLFAHLASLCHGENKIGRRNNINGMPRILLDNGK
jgi:hypothetical protein